MKPRKGRLPIHLIRRRRAYSFHDLAVLLRKHVRTVQVWRDEGMPVLDENTKPMLVMGQDARQFLRSRKQKRKRPLEAGQFYCTRCRCARESRPEALRSEVTQRLLGPRRVQILKHGICIVCGLALVRFSSGPREVNWQELPSTPPQRPEALTGVETPSLNTDMNEVSKDG
jgi:hypothetical protein